MKESNYDKELNKLKTYISVSLINLPWTNIALTTINVKTNKTPTKKDFQIFFGENGMILITSFIFTCMCPGPKQKKIFSTISDEAIGKIVVAWSYYKHYGYSWGSDFNHLTHIDGGVIDQSTEEFCKILLILFLSSCRSEGSLDATKRIAWVSHWAAYSPSYTCRARCRVSIGKEVNSRPHAPHCWGETPLSQVLGVSGRPLQLATTSFLVLCFFSGVFSNFFLCWPTWLCVCKFDWTLFSLRLRVCTACDNKISVACESKGAPLWFLGFEHMQFVVNPWLWVLVHSWPKTWILHILIATGSLFLLKLLWDCAMFISPWLWRHEILGQDLDILVLPLLWEAMCWVSSRGSCPAVLVTSVRGDILCCHSVITSSERKFFQGFKNIVYNWNQHQRRITGILPMCYSCIHKVTIIPYKLLGMNLESKAYRYI